MSAFCANTLLHVSVFVDVKVWNVMQQRVNESPFRNVGKLEKLLEQNIIDMSLEMQRNPFCCPCNSSVLLLFSDSAKANTE